MLRSEVVNVFKLPRCPESSIQGQGSLLWRSVRLTRIYNCARKKTTTKKQRCVSLYVLLTSFDIPRNQRIFKILILYYISLNMIYSTKTCSWLCSYVVSSCYWSLHTYQLAKERQTFLCNFSTQKRYSVGWCRADHCRSNTIEQSTDAILFDNFIVYIKYVVVSSIFCRLIPRF